MQPTLIDWDFGPVWFGLKAGVYSHHGTFQEQKYYTHKVAHIVTPTWMGARTHSQPILRVVAWVYVLKEERYAFKASITGRWEMLL